MSQSDQTSDAFEKLVKQATAEQSNSRPDVVHQRYIGCLVGCSLGFVAAVALFFAALLWDQAYPNPSDSDFANPIGVILFVASAVLAGGVIGMVLCPFLIKSWKRFKIRKQK